MKPIWIVDDDQSIRFVMEKALLREGMPTRSFTNPREVLAALEQVGDAEMPQVLVSDIRMPGGSGLDLLQQIKSIRPQIAVIIMTAFSDLDSAVSSFQGGAFEYLPKPFDISKAVELIRRAVQETHQEVVTNVGTDETPEMLGQAPAMQDVFRAIGRLSQSNVTVMITGESGSGKELVARALHKHSLRANGSFVAINTAAIPKDLLESELFGHERGAFTGAQTMRRGRFEQAEGGTLFLDEIGDMPFDLQTRLLRVLSDGNYYRVGGHVSIKANVRVIAATHQDLEQRVKEGSFREDLFHRLNVIRLRLPPLRERREDISVLTHYFLKQSAIQLGVEPKRISDSALLVLQNFQFPGNVRQLENICHWLSVMAPTQVVEAKDLPPEVLKDQHALEAAANQSVQLHSFSTSPSNNSLSDPVLHGDQSTQKSDVQHSSVLSPNESVLNVFGEIIYRDEGVAPLASSGMPSIHAIEAFDASAQEQMHGAVSNPFSGLSTASASVSYTNAPPLAPSNWESILESEASALLAAGRTDVWDVLTRRFEAKLIQTALLNTRGRRIEAAQKLGIGRNTITRKIQELGLEN
jgi:two-component system nitrogen regulation response regulator GlnG